MLPKNQRILAIDTATGPGGVAVWRDGKLAVLLEDKESNMQSARLMPMIERAMKQSGLAYAELTKVACTTGPGSFTGIRVGLSAARGIAFAANIPGAGFTTLEVLAFAARGNPVLAALNAGKGEWYFQGFSASGKALFATRTGAPGEALQAMPGNGTLAGNVEGAIAGLSAAALAELAASREGTALEPFYIRPPDAIIPVKNL